MLARPHQLIAATLLIVAIGAIAAAQSPIWIGIVREDGYLMPLAAITPRLFATSIPDESTAGETPIPIETFINGDRLQPEQAELLLREGSVRPFKELVWTLTSGPGSKATQIRTVEPATVRMPYCSDQIGWRTTLRRPPARENYAPIRKLGIAISGGAIEHPEDVVKQADAASRRVARRIVHLTHAKEAERFAAYAKELEHAIATSKEVAQLAKRFREYLPQESPAERARVAVKLAQLRRHSMGGLIIYYFEATKTWGRAADNGLVTGWIVESSSGLADHEVTYKFNDDTTKHNDRAIVHGVLRYHGRALWILEWHGHENVYYTLNDWPSGVTRLVVDEYNCQA
jgi:hypothetical protein